MALRTIRDLAYGSLLAASLAAAPTMALAQGVPTIDATNIAQEIKQLQQMLEDYGIQTDQLDKLVEQIEKLQEQIDQLKETYAALTGSTDIVQALMDGDGLNGLLDQEFSDVLDLIQKVQTGDFTGLIGDASGEMKGRMTKVLEEAGFDSDTLSQMASSGNAGAKNVATRASSGAVMAAAAQTSHDEAGQGMERIEDLVGMTSDMTTLKESVDHNTRVTAEAVIQLISIQRLIATQTAGIGQGGVIDAATIAEEQKYMDFTLPDLE
ncbi:type IV secretion system protein [Notoacmeibacter ruber]|uniref:Conjugal transfer protein TraF n=1 Tax=Notoacmeibacter ruber TaxID=2670375 RepID=A0A3L7J3B4_9HYPH|nr:type IV secretion system protein [Notoacmeibacter ruber]RLQ84960.1 conjugal transfer protein TraF [Notoacmeibacter ruber]